MNTGWLPDVSDWTAQIAVLEKDKDIAWSSLVALANARLDFLKTERLDRLTRRHFASTVPAGLVTPPIRLAILASSTTAQLNASIRVAALRRGMLVQLYEAPYGQYVQELLDPQSGLHQFHPDAVLFALDAHHLTAGHDVGMNAAQAAAALDSVLQRLERCWQIAREQLGAAVIQQTVLPVLPSVAGGNEHILPGAPAEVVRRLNAALREKAPQKGVSLLGLDERAAQDGVRAWHDAALWMRAKQEVSPVAAPVYGELAARLLAALRGRSSKCLVLDLDNTLWGGVIGDDGLDGIVLGQGSATGEGFLAVQAYALALARRGVILAVCSKNDEANALAPFEKHPEMLLKREHIASFVANWTDKPTNLRHIAREINIGLDSLVFLDDNPFERNLVRQALPEVAVPEWPDDDPAQVPRLLADAGYFEALRITSDDRARTGQYQANRARAELEATATDLPGYLRGLDMELVWRPFDAAGLARITQLINKTNQFNLRTRRYTEEEVVAVMDDPTAFGLQLRLLDRFGDNGIIAIVIGRMQPEGDCLLDTWLMSCRVLGRQVEEATLNLAATQARRLGARRLVGEYLPTAKNAMVSGLYQKLGFAPLRTLPDGGKISVLSLDTFRPCDVLMRMREGA